MTGQEWSDRPRYRDGGQPIETAALGPKVVRVLGGFTAAYRGPCRHRDAGQWALASDLRSGCLPCLRASASLARWESRGPCTTCGRLLEAPPARVWTVEASNGVSVCFRLCPSCAATELRTPAQPEPDREDTR